MYIYDTRESLVHALRHYATPAELVAHPTAELNRVVFHLNDLNCEYPDWELRLWIVRADLGLPHQSNAVKALAAYGLQSHDFWGLLPESLLDLLQLVLDLIDRPDVPQDTFVRQVRKFLGLPIEEEPSPISHIAT